MKIIPVIDIKNSIAVHAVKGEREKYKPLKSIFAKSSDPYEIALNMPFEEIYIADLNSILGKGNNYEIIRKIAKKKKVIADIGIRTFDDYKKALVLGVEPVVGSETLKSLEELKKIIKYGENFIFSIDIKDNSVLTEFLPKNYKKCFYFLKSLGIKKFIILNISSVGTLRGWSLDIEFLKHEKKSEEGGEITVYIGGGINIEDIKRFSTTVDGFLLGTLIHGGAISPKALLR